jgi:hypothetical protein
MERPKAVLKKLEELGDLDIYTRAIAVPDNTWSKLSALLLKYTFEEVQEATTSGGTSALEGLFNFRVEPRLEEPDTTLTPRELNTTLKRGEVASEAMQAASRLITPPVPEEDIWIVGEQIMAAVCVTVGEGQHRPLLPSSSLLGRKPTEASLLAGHGEARLVTL